MGRKKENMQKLTEFKLLDNELDSLNNNVQVTQEDVTQSINDCGRVGKIANISRRY